MHILKQQCPACRGAGLRHHPSLPVNEAVICPQCDGHAWVPVAAKPFVGRQPMKGVTVVHRSLAQCPPIDVERTGATMSVSQFEGFFPDLANKEASRLNA